MGLPCKLYFVAAAIMLLFWTPIAGQSAGDLNVSDACYSDPSQDSCQDFMRSDQDVLSDLNGICAANGSLTGCTLWGQCQNGTAGGPFCEPFSIVASLCSEASNAQGCQPYNALCATGSKAPQCSCFPAVPGMLTSADAKKAMVDLCWTHYMTQCDQCGGEGDPSAPGPCQAPLSTLSSACQEMPDMAECSGLWGMCEAAAVASAFPKLCSKTGKVAADWTPPPTPTCGPTNTPSPAPSPASPSAVPSPSPDTPEWGTPSRNMDDPCYTNPADASCADFERSDADLVDDIAKLCHDMPFMIGCTFWEACKDSDTTGANGDFCKPISIAGNLCVDMPRMKGCEAYVALCDTRGSQVAQCRNPGPVPNVITTFLTRDQIQGMCSTHGMVGCDRCVGSSWTECTDPLDTISQLCLGMPQMSDCSGFFSMCESGGVQDAFPSICTPDGRAQSQGEQTIPPMKMYLHQSWTEIILTLNWIPRTKGAMVGAWFACFLSAVFVQALKTWRLLVEARWARKRLQALHRCCTCGIDHEVGSCKSVGKDSETDSLELGEDGSSSGTGGHRRRRRMQNGLLRTVENAHLLLFRRPMMTKEQLRRNFIRGLFTTFIVFIDYMLMLIVMTFNVAIIIWTCVGFGVGALIFGHFGEQPIEKGTPGQQLGGKGQGQAGAGAETAPTCREVESQFLDNGGCCGGQTV